MGGVLGTDVSAAELSRTYPQTEVNLLIAALHPDPNPAKGGGDINIEDDTLLASLSIDAVSATEVEASSNQIARYVVRSGDTLSSIARMFGVSVNTVRWSNDVNSSSIIRVGQELLILPIDGVRHTVKNGDTIASIAKKFKGDVKEIQNFNDLKVGEVLVVGEVVVIPDGVIVTSPANLTRITGKNRITKHGGPSIDGYYLRPVSGPKTQSSHGNNGVDMGSPTGTSVLASAGGEVLIARGLGWNGGYGQMIVIAHPNDTQTLYAHLSQVDVVPGEFVIKGERIGAVGNTGRSTGPHLHFEVRGAQNPF
ncbi:MAG TPA: M23 family metallopeptidase [Candidatus Paceibacterota bacterium]